MNCITPIEFENISIDELLNNKKIVLSKYNLPYYNSIFPKSTPLNTLDQFSRNSIITQLDDEIFDDFIIIQKPKQIIYTENNTKRLLIKCKEFGDYSNSYKRHNNVNAPFGYSTDAEEFLNLKVLPKQIQTQTKKFIIPKPDSEQEYYKDEPNNLPQVLKTNNTITRFNDLTTIKYVLKWAKEQGIKYIYCIVENRPCIINKTYSTPYAYYTVIGSK